MSRAGVTALDLASRTGFAHGVFNSDRKPLIDSVALAPKGSIAERGAALMDWLADHDAVCQPASYVYEAPIPRGSGGKGANAGFLLIGLAMLVEVFCFRRSIPCHMQEVSTVRKAVLGRGNATKDDAFEWCKKAGWDPQDYDAADAGILLRFAWMFPLKGTQR